MNRTRVVALIAVIGILLAGILPAAHHHLHLLDDWLAGVTSWHGAEHPTGHYTIVDENGLPLLRTAVTLRRGDLYIDPADSFHRVVGIRGDVVLTAAEPTPPLDEAPLLSLTFSSAVAHPDLAVPLGTARQVILIYHSHSDESYLPTDGRSAIPGNGGIYDVGASLASSLSTLGFTVIHDRTAHDPHDAGAYPRSRRTVRRNLQYGPTLLLDLHRDASPASEYQTEIGGLPASKILFVVGGANPLRAANTALARRMSALSEELYPGIVRGILVARGNYNQDLDPGAMLLEMGTYLIPKEQAQRTAALFANVVSALLGPPGPDGATGPPND